MFLQWKLIFQKTNIKYFISILLASFLLLGFWMFTNDSCTVDSVVINNQINSYEKSLDPEFCENILEQIDIHNDQCESQIEILDCG